MKLSPNEISSEIAKVAANDYRQFVKRIKLVDVRGFHDEVIEYMSPVTALIGTNGGGKSTILGATALAYKSTKPRKFFPKAFIGDETMSNWSIEYELVDKKIFPDRLVNRTARFTQTKWRRDDFPERNIEYIEIQRTVPASELPRFRKFLAGDRNLFNDLPLNNNTVKYASAVLDKDIASYRLVSKKDAPHEKMYIGSTIGVGGYSQFHFGAGEASIIETIDRIENAPDNLLILIEEVENGLHPIAVRLFVHYLQNAAKRKRLQVVFTTHSQDAINELPAKAVWASINKRIWNGKLSIESLRAITGEVPDERAIFVEDDFVKEWVSNSLGRYGGDLVSTTRIFKAGGYPNCVKVSEFHNLNPMLTVPSVALVDGDIYDPDTGGDLPENACFIGLGCPEAVVFDFIFERRKELASVLRQRCYLTQFGEDRIVSEIESVRNSACNSHTIFSVLSEKLDFVSAIYIRAGMIDVFNEENPFFWDEVIEFIRNKTRPIGEQH